MASTPAEIVDREARQRRPAVIAAVVGTLLTAIAIILDQLIAKAGIPEPKIATDLVESISAQLTGTDFPNSFWTAYAQFKIDHGTQTVLVAVLRGLAFIGFAPIALLLLRGARERGGQLAKFLEPLVVIGLVAAGVATIASGIAEISAFKSAEPELFPKDVVDALGSSSVLTINAIRTIAALVVAVPLALGSIQALRVGLLPRVIGFMGVAVGLLFVIPYDQTGLLRGFWFAAVAFIISGRASGGMPEAWSKGEAVVAGPRLPPEPRAPRGGKKGKRGQSPTFVKDAADAPKPSDDQPRKRSGRR